MRRHEFDLKLSDGRWVVWDGETPIDAAERYANAHRGEAVIAWRRHTVTNVVIPYADARLIVEPHEWPRFDRLQRQRWAEMDRAAGRSQVTE